MCHAYMFVTLIVLATVFSMACYKLVLKCSLVVYHGISHLSLVFSFKLCDILRIYVASQNEIQVKMVLTYIV